ncbi:hypothetical protein PIB30_021540 [Stylosanthes scabra]|uniref:Cytochrome P450 71A1 n=1 Tax=Stylosanthes scabra TaxID=79078 RepID=A0ABU6S8N7_9FABA|nr:hypothetical protein [Stylosanthes scabra]
MALKELSCPTFELCLSLFSTIITIIIVLKLRSVRVKSKENIVTLPPSPRKLPIIGNLHQIGALPYRSFKGLSEKYGDVMLLQLGHIPTVVVSSAQVVNEIMKGNDLALSNRGQSRATNILLYGSNDIGFGNYGERWKQKRKICVRELLSPKMVESESIRLVREGAVAELVDKVREAAAAAGSVNLSELLVEAANNIICNSALGLKNDEKGVRRKHSVKALAKKVMFQVGVVTLGDHFPWLAWLDVLTGHLQQFKATFQALDPLFDDLIAERTSSIINRETPAAHQTDFVDILIQIQHQQLPNNNAISNNDIKSILLDMFAAGSETTSVTVEWAMSELMKNPIELKKVQEEVRRVVGQKSNVEESKVKQMEYLKCVVKETLRLHPPAPLLVPRVATHHVKLGGYDIPAKTRLYVNVWAIQRDPQVWDNPEEFIPERHRHSHDTQDFTLIPFGFGRRGCPGMNFGLAAVEYMLANLLYYFNWESPQAQAIDMTEIFGLVASKRIPLHLKPIPFSFQ